MKFIAVLLFTALALGDRHFDEPWSPNYGDAPVITCQDKPGLRCNPSIGLDCCPLLDCTADCPGCWGYVSISLHETYTVADIL
ncbi:hypothetical protein DPV78_003598 [Talaromyces pinophilus]|nr:hypothetical protein DPV78_003598 [Talaromyces pinophilus]